MCTLLIQRALEGVLAGLVTRQNLPIILRNSLVMKVMPVFKSLLCRAVAPVLLLAVPAVAAAQNRVCVAPDNGRGTIDWPAQCPYGNTLDPVRVVTSDGEEIEFSIAIPPIVNTCLPRNPPEYHSGLNSQAAPIAIPAFIKYVKQSKTSEAGMNLKYAVRNTPLSAAGADVQKFDTEIISMSLVSTGNPQFPARTTLNVVPSQSSGGTTIKRLPSGDFNVDSFFDIWTEVSIVGDPGTALEGVLVNTTRRIRLTQTTSCFQGVCYTPLDGGLVTPEGTKLKVSNLGSSGCDGVSISPGGGGTGDDDDCDGIAVGIEACSATGVYLADGETMSMYPFPASAVGSAGFARAAEQHGLDQYGRCRLGGVYLERPGSLQLAGRSLGR